MKQLWIDGTPFDDDEGNILVAERIEFGDDEITGITGHSHVFRLRGLNQASVYEIRDEEGNAVKPEPPRSMHIAALTAVDTVNKKGTVVRKWLGQNYTYDNCYVSLQALEAYQAGKIKLFNPAFGINAPENADSFVLVYFVSENPYDESLEIPVIVDKLVK